MAISEGLTKNEGLPFFDFGFELAYYRDIHYKRAVPPMKDKEPYRPAENETLTRYEVSIWDRIRDAAQNWADNPADWLEEHSHLFSRFARRISRKTMADLADYFTVKEDRRKTQQRLIDLIENHQGDEIMLIAHSMGAIVAYDVLRIIGRRQPAQRVPVSHFVTIGSPLGLTPVKGEILIRHKGRLRTPSVVTHSWHNFSDPGDFVCLDTHIRDDYAGNSSGIRVRDQLVHNEYPGNEHKSYGYLRTPELSNHIASFL